jgi:hypothetical protein
MYIVGHCLSAVDGGACAPEEMDGTGIVATMIPDILDNHGWGYGVCFAWPARTAVTRFVRAHVIGDWFVHFGQDTQVQEREGWAYRQMGYYADKYEAFFECAHARGFAAQAAPTDSRRGFAHTMSEYAVDFRLSRQGRFDAYFEMARRALGAIGRDDDDGPGSSHWLRQVIDGEKMPTKYRDAAPQVESFRARAGRAAAPEDFVVFSVLSKLGFDFTSAAQAFVAEALDSGADGIGAHEIDLHYQECCAFVGKHI